MIFMTITLDKDKIFEALKEVYDPEIPVNIVDLGLIYSCEFSPMDNNDTLVKIKMTLIKFILILLLKDLL